MQVIKPIVQDNSQATFCSKIKKENGFVDISLLTASEIYTKYKAYIIFPKTTVVNDVLPLGSNFKILKCSLVAENESLDIENLEKISEFLYFSGRFYYLLCGKNTFLEVSQIMNLNGKVINLTGKTFLN